MKKVEAQKVLIDLDDKPIVVDPQSKKPLTVGIGLGIILQGYRGNEKGGAIADPLKCLELARMFYKTKKPVTIDAVDLALVTKGVKEDKRFGPLVLGQLLEALQDAKEVKGSEKE